MASRKEILELLAGGKISADEAAEMLAGAESVAEKAPPPSDPAPIFIAEEDTAPQAVVANGKGARWFRVRVRNLETGKNKVNVNIPIRMLKFGMSIGRRFAPEIDELGLNDLDGMIQGMETGMLVEVQDEESNEHVQVYLE